MPQKSTTNKTKQTNKTNKTSNNKQNKQNNQNKQNKQTNKTSNKQNIKQIKQQINKTTNKHTTGVHSKAVMTNPSCYEVIDPNDFGVERKIQLAHRLTGWNAMQNRAKQLSLNISDDQIKAATTLIKNLADGRSITMDQVCMYAYMYVCIYVCMHVYKSQFEKSVEL